jgi:hypothetical protein
VFRSRRFVALTGDLWRALVAVLVAGVLVAALVYDLFAARQLLRLELNDFGKFYLSTRQFLDGQDMYAPNAATTLPVGDGRTHVFLNLNPPHFHLVLLPIARLQPTAALAVWSLASLIALACSLVLIVRELDLRPTPAALAWWGTAMLAWAATGALLITGQVALLLMLVVTLAWISARRNQWTAAGGWLGLLASVKPLFLIFVPWLIARRAWRSLGAMGLTWAAAFAAGLAVFGLDAHRQWLEALRTTNWEWAAMNVSLLGAASRWFAPSPYFTPLLLAPSIVRPLWLAAAVVVGLWTLRSVVRSGHDIDRAFAMMMLAALLVSPLGWVYYWWLPVGPMAALLRRPPAAFWIAAPLMALPLVGVTAGQPNGWMTVTLGSAYFWATLLAWAAVCSHAPAARGHWSGS